MNNNLHSDQLVSFLTGHLKDPPAIEALRQSALSRNIPVIQRESAEIVRLLIRVGRINSLLEIGTAVGYSTALFWEAMKEGRIVTIERNRAFAREAAENLQALGCRGAAVVEGDALEKLKVMEGPYDLIFIDAGKSHYRAYFDLAFPLLKPGGLIVSDNILMNGLTLGYDMKLRKNRTMVRSMRGYLSFLTGHPELETAFIPAGDGLAVSLHTPKGAFHD